MGGAQKLLVCKWEPRDRWRLYAVCRDFDAARRLLVTLITEQLLSDSPVQAERYNGNVVGLTEYKEAEISRHVVRKGLRIAEAYTRKELREELDLRIDGRCRVYDATVRYGEEEETDEVGYWQIDCDFYIIELR
jgi:hypothetical protein